MSDDESIDGVLRALHTACGVLAGGAVTALAVVWIVLQRGDAGPVEGGPLPRSFLLMIVAMMLVLLSSAARGAVLRKAVEAGEDERHAAEEDGLPTDPTPIEPLLRAYRKATLVCFTLLAVASGMGLGMAVLGGAPQYGLLLCAICPIVMAARWPRRVAIDLLLEGNWGR